MCPLSLLCSEYLVAPCRTRQLGRSETITSKWPNWLRAAGCFCSRSDEEKRAKMCRIFILDPLNAQRYIHVLRDFRPF